MKTLNSLRLKDNETKAINELKSRILRSYPDAELILFGSKARGDYNEYSDIDVLILVNRIDNTVELKLSDIIYETILNYGIPLNETFAEKKLLKTSWTAQIPFYANIKREGIII